MAAPMASFGFCGKLYPLFTHTAHLASVPAHIPASGRGSKMLVGLAIALFVALFGWGASYFGWDDPAGKVRLALFTCFTLGVLCGTKSKG
jgi:hypothetical protein